MPKRCPRCKERPIASRVGWCNECKAAYSKTYRKANSQRLLERQKVWRKANPEKVAGHTKKWKLANPERCAELQKEFLKRNPGYKTKYRIEWNKKNPNKCREYSLKYLYGMTEEQFQALLEKQKFSCAVCETDLRNEIVPNIDHCHSTGIVRGILCGNCNRAIGLMKEDAIKIRRLAKYVLKFQRRK